MKAGTQTNSLTNHLMSTATKGQPDPTVGMGATVLGWTDRHAATIAEVGKWRHHLMVTVRRDEAKRTDKNGISECQTYAYTENKHGMTYRFWFDLKRQEWRELYVSDDLDKLTTSKPGQGKGLLIGERCEYRDWSF
jgi:hypothetical protein